MAANKKTSRRTRESAYTIQSSEAWDVKEVEDFSANVPAKEKLDIFEVLAAIDHKDRDYYDRLSDKMQKSLPMPVLARWLSDVQGSADMQHWYLVGTNVHANLNMYNLPSDDQGQRHDKLSWLCLTVAGAGFGKQRHGWLGLKKDEPNARIDFLSTEFPAMKRDDIELLASLLTDDEIKSHLRSSGQAT